MKYLIAALFALSLIGCAHVVTGMPEKGIITTDLPEIGDFAYVKAEFPNKDTSPSAPETVTYEFVGKVINIGQKMTVRKDEDGTLHIEKGIQIFVVQYRDTNYYIGTGGDDIVRKVNTPETKSSEDIPFDGFTPDGALKPSGPEKGKSGGAGKQDE